MVMFNIKIKIMKQFLFLVALILMSSCNFATAKSEGTTDAAKSEETADATKIEEVTDAQMPSLKQLCTLFTNLEKRNFSAVTDYGFVLSKEKTKKVLDDLSEYGEEGFEEVTYHKNSYSLKYNVTKEMKMEYIYMESRNEDGYLTISCDNETWDSYYQEAKKISNKDFGKGVFGYDYYYISLEEKGKIIMGYESSVGWPEYLSLSDLIDIYNKKDKTYAAEIFKENGYKAVDGNWVKKTAFNLNISYDGKIIRIEANSEDGSNPFAGVWMEELSKQGYKGVDSSVGMVNRTDYTKRGLPMISIGCAMETYVLCVGEQADM